MKQNKLREKMTETFLAALKEEQLPWHAMWHTQRPQNAISGKRYRGINSFWLSFIAEEKGYDDPRWCTYKQAEAKGWQVRAGEKASQVEFWNVFDKEKKRYIDFSEARKVISQDPEREKDMVLCSRVYSVFNIQQIDGAPAQDKPKSAVDIATIRAKRDVLLKNMDLKFREGGSEAYYQPSIDRITMPRESSFVDTYGYMSTFLHEASHASGAKSRLNRDMSGSFGSPEYAKEELRAEIASAFTSQTLGFGREGNALEASLDNHKAYIQNWISVIEDQPNELFAAIKDADEIADYLLEKGEFLKDLDREEPGQVQSVRLDERILAAAVATRTNASRESVSDFVR